MGIYLIRRLNKMKLNLENIINMLEVIKSDSNKQIWKKTTKHQKY